MRPRCKMPADGLESGLIDLLADHCRELAALGRPRRETRFPMPERAVAVGDGQQANMRDIVEHRDRRIEQAIAEGLFEIGQRQQLLAQFGAVLELEASDAADLVGGLRALDRAGRDRRMPAVVAVEVAQHVPDRDRSARRGSCF